MIKDIFLIFFKTLKKTLNFRGRSSQREYVIFTFFVTLIHYVFNILIAFMLSIIISFYYNSLCNTNYTFLSDSLEYNHDNKATAQYRDNTEVTTQSNTSGWAEES